MPVDSWMWPWSPSERLDSLEEGPDGRAADGPELHLSHRLDDPERVVEDRRLVEPGAERRDVDVDHEPPRVGNKRLERRQRGGELVLGLLAVAVPGRDVREAPRDQLVLVVEREHAALRVLAPGGALEEGGQLGRVVVAEHQEEADPLGAEPLVGEGQPLFEAARHELAEQPVERAVGLTCLELARPPRGTGSSRGRR